MGLFSRDRYFVVIGTLKVYSGPWEVRNLPGKASVTLTARNHDDAERQACHAFRIGDEMCPERFLRVEEVREIRRK